MTTVCRECGETFRKFSLKSREKICHDCKGSKGRNRYKVMTNNTLNAIGTIENLDKKVAELTTSIDVLHSTIAVEVQHQITKGIEPIIEKILDGKISELKDIVLSSMTKAQKTQKEVKELNKLVKGYKSSNTRMKNKIKKFEERFANE
jgi:Mg2+ and Co2+ transporter CorA